MKSGLFAAIISILAVAPGAALAKDPTLCVAADGTVSARTKCKTGESVFSIASVATAVSANVAAPAGPAGPAGSVGPTGPTGPRGATGPRGLTSIAIGPRGSIDFSACHRVVSGPASASSQITLAASCDSVNEFMFEDEWGFTGGPAFLQTISKSYSFGSNNEQLPYSLTITANVIAGQTYSLSVTAICCPR